MFDIHRQTWQCSIITNCGDELLRFCQLAVSTQCGGYYGEMQTKNQSPRHTPELGGGGQWSQMTSAKRRINYAHQSFVTTP